VTGSFAAEQASAFVRRFAANEVMTIVAEDVPELRRWLKRAITGGQKHGLRVVPPEHQLQTRAQVTAGQAAEAKLVGLSHIVDVVHFVEKQDAPLLQLADACAFGFRRFFAEQSGGDEFILFPAAFFVLAPLPAAVEEAVQHAVATAG